MVRYTIFAVFACLLWAGSLVEQTGASPATGEHVFEAVQQSTPLPQRHSHQGVIYDWLQTLSVSDVSTQGLGRVSFSPNSNATNDELYALDLSLRSRAPRNHVLRFPDNQFVLDDGNGNGFEANGSVRFTMEMQNPNNPSDRRSRAVLAESAWWVALDIPGLNNPYYDNDNAKRKILAQVAVDLLMLEETVDEEDASNGRYLFMALNDAAGAFYYTRDILPTATQQAFVESMVRIAEGIRTTSSTTFPDPANENMNTKGISALAQISVLCEDLGMWSGREQVIDHAKAALFGDENNDAGHDNSYHVNTIFDAAGHITEDGGAATTYNGIALGVLVRAAGVTRHDPDWAFMHGEDGVIDRIGRWKILQHLPDGDDFYKGPSGYSTRMSRDIVVDQSRSEGRDALHAQLSDWSLPLLRRPRSPGHAGFLPSSRSNMASNIQSSLDSISWGNISLSMRNWEVLIRWEQRDGGVFYSHYDEGIYDAFKALDDSDDDLLEVPYGRDDDLNIRLGPDVRDEWWFRKKRDGNGRELGWIVQMVYQPGDSYAGGGALEAFWTRETGPIILGVKPLRGVYRPSRGASIDDVPVTPTAHLWGKDNEGRTFTSSVVGRWMWTNGRPTRGQSKLLVESGADYMRQVLNPARHRPSDDQTEFWEDVEVETRVDEIRDGLQMTQEVGGDGTVSEMWLTIPVHLRHVNQPSSVETTIEYWTGSSWSSLGTSVQSNVRYLRLGRDFGSGANYVYIELDEGRDVYRTATIDRTGIDSRDRSDFYTRNVHIDIHGNPGTNRSLGSSEIYAYTIQTSDPTSDEAADWPGDDEVSEPIEQVLSLQGGWNLTSLSVELEDYSMEAVLADVLDDIQLVKNADGDVFSPEFGIDDIGTWDVNEAYWMYATSEIDLTLEGEPLEPTSTSIALSEGWRLVPYIGDTSIAVEEAFASVADDLVMVQDAYGNVYFPQYGVDEINTLQPGRGYLIYVEQSSTLTFPEEVHSVSSTTTGLEPTPTTFDSP